MNEKIYRQRIQSGLCPYCGSKLVRRDARAHSFLGCSDFPVCRFSINFDIYYKIKDSEIDEKGFRSSGRA